jgi:hypothetical protein
MDKRETILERVLAILTAIPQQMSYDQNSVFRNRGELPEDKRPSLILLDGVEHNVTPPTGTGKGFMRPSVMRLLPQIFVLLKPRDHVTNEGVGEELSAFRSSVIKAIGLDRELIQLCGSNGQVALLSSETDMQTGSTLQGELRLDFAIDYVLDPNAL